MTRMNQQWYMLCWHASMLSLCTNNSNKPVETINQAHYCLDSKYILMLLKYIFEISCTEVSQKKTSFIFGISTLENLPLYVHISFFDQKHRFCKVAALQLYVQNFSLRTLVSSKNHWLDIKCSTIPIKHSLFMCTMYI